VSTRFTLEKSVARLVEVGQILDPRYLAPIGSYWMKRLRMSSGIELIGSLR